MKWMVIKGVRYPSSVISAFAAYNMDNPFLKVRIRNKYHIVPFEIPREDGGGDPGDSSGDAGRERAPCRRVYVYGQDGEHDGYRYLYIKGRG